MLIRSASDAVAWKTLPGRLIEPRIIYLVPLKSQPECPNSDLRKTHYLQVPTAATRLLNLA